MKIELIPVAYVTNSRKVPTDDFWGGIISKITLTDEFPEEAFKGINEFSHVEIIFYFDKADSSKVIKADSHPRGNVNWPKTGIFVQRKKDRPNHLGLTIAKIEKVEGKSLFVTGLDAIDGTPVLDIKPVVKGFLPHEEISQPVWADELMKNYWENNSE